MHLVGLGPGPLDQLTLHAWELLASGKPLLLRDPDHEVTQDVLARGFSFETVEGTPNEIAERVISWATAHDESVYAVAGGVAEAPEVAPLILGAKDAGLEVEIVPAVWGGESLPASDPETFSHAGPQAARAGSALSRLVSIMARLRSPNGCPWDREQDHASLAIHLLEEAHETLDAIDRDDMKDLEEELGDLLLQVVFHAELADEEGHFEMSDVIEDLIGKLVHRHPHIFGDVSVSSARDVVSNWEALKHEQKERASLDEGIPKTLPALLYAHKVQRRLAGATKEFSPSADRLVELIDFLAGAGDPDRTIGEILYEVVALAQRAGVDPEGALRRQAADRLTAQRPDMA